MQDKDIYENLLTLTKNLTTLLLHASTEASNDEVFTSFRNALDDTVQLQHAVYKCMENHGFYQIEQVKQTQITQLQEKFDECYC